MLLKTYNIGEDLSVMLICRYSGFLYMYYIHVLDYKNLYLTLNSIADIVDLFLTRKVARTFLNI